MGKIVVINHKQYNYATFLEALRQLDIINDFDNGTNIEMAENVPSYLAMLKRSSKHIMAEYKKSKSNKLIKRNEVPSDQLSKRSYIYYRKHQKYYRKIPS